MIVKKIHIANEQTGSEKWSNLPKGTGLIRSGAGPHTQVCFKAQALTLAQTAQGPLITQSFDQNPGIGIPVMTWVGPPRRSQVKKMHSHLPAFSWLPGKSVELSFLVE